MAARFRLRSCGSSGSSLASRLGRHRCTTANPTRSARKARFSRRSPIQFLTSDRIRQDLRDALNCM